MDYGTSSDRPRMITGVFHDRESAERAYRTITDRGYDRDDVNMLMSDDTRKRHFDTTENTTVGGRALDRREKSAQEPRESNENVEKPVV